MKRRTFISIGAAASAGFAAPALARYGRLDLTARLGADAQFLTLCDALVAADLIATLQGPGPYTVFAPKLSAFDRLGRREVDRLTQPAMRDVLRRILAYHIVPGRYSAFDLTGARADLPTLAGTPLRVDGISSPLRVGHTRVVRAEIDAANGVIHEIEQVLRPV